jgi:hypothetical protein
MVALGYTGLGDRAEAHYTDVLELDRRHLGARSHPGGATSYREPEAKQHGSFRRLGVRA